MHGENSKSFSSLFLFFVCVTVSGIYSVIDQFILQCIALFLFLSLSGDFFLQR